MISHAAVHTFELSIPVLLVLWANAFDANFAVLGVAVSLGYGLFGLGSLPSGILTDRFRSSSLLAGGLLGMGVGFALVALAESSVTLALGLAVWGIAASFHHPASLTLLSQRPSNRGNLFAFHGMAGNFGTAVGPFLVALLLAVSEWRTVVALLGGVAIVAALGVVLLRRSVPQSAPNGGDVTTPSADELLDRTRALFRSNFVWVFVVLMLGGLYYRAMLTFLPDLIARLDVVAAASGGPGTLEASRYVYSGLLLVGMVGQFVGGKLSDRVPIETGLALFFVGYALVSLLFVAAVNLEFVPFLGVSILLVLVLFGEQPFGQAAVAKHSPSSVRGLSYGFVYVGIFGVGSLGAALAGTVLTYFGETTLFLVLIACGLAAASLVNGLRRRERATEVELEP